MGERNPWLDLAHEDYEGHMGHVDVRQLETLSRVFGEQLSLVADREKSVVAVLGIAGGNGLEHVVAGRYRAVVGLDINGEYLEICHARYGRLSELTLHQIDLMIEKDRAVGLLAQASLVTANLLVSHIHLGNFIDIVGRLQGAVISITIQVDFDGWSLSCSGCEGAFEDIQAHGLGHDEGQLTAAMAAVGYGMVGRYEYGLPNKKMLVRIDYAR